MTESADSLTDNDELADTTERTAYNLVPIDSALLTSPAVLRAVAGIGIGLAILAWPNRTDRILARIIGIAIVWLAITSIQAALKARPRNRLMMAVGVVGVAAGTFLVVTPDQSASFLGRLIGAAALLVAARIAIDGRRDPDAENWMTSTVALTAAGLLTLSFPEQVLAAATTIAAAGWITVSVIVVAVSLDGRRTGTTDYQGVMQLVQDWLIERPKSADARQALYAKILYEGPNTQRRIVRFSALMGFAAVIASMGVITDSTAVVIGAMLIAPLMTPLMGMAISLVMGWPNRLARATSIALSGIVFAIGIGLLLGLIAPTVINTATNTQIVARSSPTVLDLIIAVAAGAAGAYGLSRPDVSDSLPGVAIAISLVPPLTVVGIAYSQGDWGAGNGALLLFTTNMVAILIMGGLTFVVTGVTPIAQVAENQHRVRTSLAAVGVASAIVFGGLTLNGDQITSNALELSNAESTVDDWLVESPLHTLVTADIEDATVTAVIIGPSDGLGDIDQLAADLTEALDRRIEVEVRLIVEERLTSAAG